MTEASEGKDNQPLLRSASAVRADASKPWLIDQLLELGKLGVIYGPPKSGRSFVALDLAVAAANGEPWFGRQVKQVPVTYVWNGDASSCSRRLEALSKRGRRLPDTLRVFGGTFGLGFKRSVWDGDKEPEPLVREINAANARDGLIVIDSAMETWTMFNEVPHIVAECAALSEQTGCAVVLVDQFGTVSRTNNTPRELSGILGSVDFAVQVALAQFGDREWTITAAREAASGERRSFDLVPVQISENNFGHQSTACVVEDRGVDRGLDDLRSAGQSEK
jgi:RecA-family ATPase